MTLAMLLAASLSPTQMERETDCLAMISYREARGESSYTAKIAAPLVAGNRVLHEDFPNTPCEVLLQPYQFSFMNGRKSIPNPPQGEAWEIAQQAAQDVLDIPVGEDGLGMNNALYFHSGKRPDWDMSKIELTSVVGNHRFYSNI